MTPLINRILLAGAFSSISAIANAQALFLKSLTISILLMSAVSLPATAQTPNMRRIQVGNTFITAQGSELKLLQFSVKVAGDKCFTSFKNQDIRTEYLSSSTAEYVASKKDGGIMCTDGTFQGAGQDGQRFSGNSSVNIFIKNGVNYSVPR